VKRFFVWLYCSVDLIQLVKSWIKVIRFTLITGLLTYLIKVSLMCSRRIPYCPLRSSPIILMENDKCNRKKEKTVSNHCSALRLYSRSLYRQSINKSNIFLFRTLKKTKMAHFRTVCNTFPKRNNCSIGQTWTWRALHNSCYSTGISEAATQDTPK
jgi:hypothetical protein